MVHDNQRNPAEMLLYVHVSFAFISSAGEKKKTSHSRVRPLFVIVFFLFLFFVVVFWSEAVPAREQIVRLCVMFINLCPEIFKAAFRNSFGVISHAGLGTVLWAGEEKKKNN